MGHKRIKMELIRKEKSRMLTFQKRKAGLLKKASEFSILCGVDACVIIFGQKQNDQPVAAETWPSDSDEVRNIIYRYKASDRPRRCYQLSDYFAEKKKKIDAELATLHKQIYNSKYPVWDDHLNCFSADQLKALLVQLDAKTEVADRILRMFKANRYAMDKGSSLWMQSSSQHFGNVSGGTENCRKRSDDMKNSANFLHLSSNSNPFDFQLPFPFKPDHSSSQTTTHQENFMQRNNSDGYSTDQLLQLFTEPKPLNTLPSTQNSYWTPPPPTLTDDAVMKMLSYRNHNDRFGWNPSSSSQFLSSNELPCVSPASLMWDCVWSNSADSSTSYVASAFQPTLPYMQFPMISFPQQMQFAEVNESSGNFEFERKGPNYK